MKIISTSRIEKMFKKAASLLVMAIFFTGIAHAQQQHKTTMNVKDIDSGIKKYVEKNYKDFKIVEAFKYGLIYKMTIQKESSIEHLVFDGSKKFMFKATEADKAKVALQTRMTMSLNDVESDITKYVKKNYEGYKITEAFKYEEVYGIKIVKGAESESLVFDKEGKFVMKSPVAKTAAAAPALKADSVPAKPGAQPQKKDSVPAPKEMKEEPAQIDTTKK